MMLSSKVEYEIPDVPCVDIEGYDAIALQSAIGGMVLSMPGMGFAATGHLSPVAGAITQEVINILAVLNALRTAFPPKVMHDL